MTLWLFAFYSTKELVPEQVVITGTCAISEHQTIMKLGVAKKVAGGGNGEWEVGDGGLKDVIDRFDSNANLSQFVCHFPFLLAPARPDSSVLFQLVDFSKEKLDPSPSPFCDISMVKTTERKPRSKRENSTLLFSFVLAAWLDTKDLIVSTCLLTLPLLSWTPFIIDQKLAAYLADGRATKISPTKPFIAFPLGQRIYRLILSLAGTLSYPRLKLINPTRVFFRLTAYR